MSESTAIVVHDPFLNKLGGMLKRADAILGLDEKGEKVNAGADGLRSESSGARAGSTAPSAPAPFTYSGALVARDFAGVSVPDDAKHARPKRATVIATLCPDCGEPMEHCERETSEDGDGRCFEISAAGWGCECGFFMADE